VKVNPFKMKQILVTNPNDWAALIARLTVGIVVFPHGAQKLLGWFGGNGFNGTMGFLTTQANLPWLIALLVILIESIGSLLLIFGFLTRIAALGMIGNFIGIILTSHLNNGFFMNWSNQPNKGEGYEFHLLVLGLSLACLIAGGGRWSTDAALSSNRKY
jgi:putative oxidoreductase